MNQPHDIFFTGATSPRDCIMIGGVGGVEGAIYLEFRTQRIPTVETRTLVFCNGQHEPVAAFEWTLDTHLGTAIVGNRPRFHMSELVHLENPPTIRSFQTPDGQRFYWRKLEDVQNAYDLYLGGPNQYAVAHFRSNGMTNTPIGPCHAYMQCWLADETQLLYASLALCLNRWIDWHGL